MCLGHREDECGETGGARLHEAFAIFPPSEQEGEPLKDSEGR